MLVIYSLDTMYSSDCPVAKKFYGIDRLGF